MGGLTHENPIGIGHSGTGWVSGGSGIEPAAPSVKSLQWGRDFMESKATVSNKAINLPTAKPQP